MKGLRLLALLIICSPLSAQGQQQEETWKKIVSPEGGFVVTLPDGATKHKRFMGEPQGPDDDRMGEGYLVIYKDLRFEAAFANLSAADVKQKKQLLANMTVKNLAPGWGTALCQTKFTINGHAAVETLFYHPVQGYFRLRQVVTEKHYYYLVVQGKVHAGDVNMVRTDEAERFLQSFEITDKKTK